MMNTAERSKVFRFYTHTEYRAELVKLLQKTKTGDRVLLISMLLEPTEPEIAAIMHELEQAASRGVIVSLAIDAHSFLIDAPTHLPGPLLARRTLPRYISKTFKSKLEFIETLNTYPTARADIVNLPASNFSLPISGRSHIKAAIINNHIFLGGCNLGHSQYVDIMVGWSDRAMSEKLYTIFQNIIHHKHAGKALSWVDRSIDVAADSNIYIDSGLRGQSLIFDEALKLIDTATKWLVITGQYFPNSITAKHLAKAVKRGIKVEVIYSHPTHHGLIGGAGQQISILRERARLPKLLFENGLSRNDPMLHAKLIASDSGVMIGSHNYVSAGVMLGTAEIALKISSEQIAREAISTLHRGLKAAPLSTKSMHIG